MYFNEFYRFGFMGTKLFCKQKCYYLFFIGCQCDDIDFPSGGGRINLIFMMPFRGDKGDGGMTTAPVILIFYYKEDTNYGKLI